VIFPLAEVPSSVSAVVLISNKLLAALRLLYLPISIFPDVTLPVDRL
jgi:hypothetical protein